MKKKWLSRGVITIEASYIIPWSVLIIALLITMLFFVHNRAWYTAAACETALSGNRYVEGSAGTGSAGLHQTRRYLIAAFGDSMNNQFNPFHEVISFRPRSR